MPDVVIADDFPGATIRRRKKNETPLSDSCCTPRWLADLLYSQKGLFDFDPCSNPRSWIQAAWSWSLEKHIDGLKMPWRGTGFQNHPYSNPMPWMKKANRELSIGNCTELTILAKMDPSVKWWGVITAPMVFAKGRDKSGRTEWFFPDLWMFNERIEFDQPPELVEMRMEKIAEAKAAGRKPPPLETSNNFASAIIHWRFDAEPWKLDKYATLWRRP